MSLILLFLDDAGRVSLLDPIRSGIERYSVAAASASVRVIAGTLGDRAEVLGAAGLILACSAPALARLAER